jgi:hypothetical protein
MRRRLHKNLFLFDGVGTSPRYFTRTLKAKRIKGMKMINLK